MTSVCLVTQQFPPETMWGGIGTYVSLLAEGLSEAGCRVTVITRSLTNTVRREERDGVVIWRMPNAVGPTPLPNFIARPLVVRRSLQILRCHFDVVEYPSWSGEGALVDTSAAAVVAVRLLTTMRTVQRYWKVSLQERVSAPIFGALEAASVRRATVRMSGTGAHARAAAREFAIPLESIAVVPFGIRLPPRRKLSEAPLVLIVGGLAPRKGTEIALEAAGIVADAMPEARFVFAGEVGRDLEGRSYRDVVAGDDRLRRSVTLQGRVDKASLEELRARAKVILVPSLSESFGLTYLEAMAAYRPLVAFDIPAAHELLGHAGFPLVPPTAEALADDVLGLLSNRDWCARRAESGWNLVRDRYTVERMVMGTLAAYRRTN